MDIAKEQGGAKVYGKPLPKVRKGKNKGNSMKSTNFINHIALVLDASASMSGHKDQLISIADAQIAHLARRSKELDQETRVTVYTFDSAVTCAIYDRDVLRLPSIAGHYKVGGNTALIDAVLKSQDDLAMTPEIYGEHAFLTFVLTDGEENSSRGNANGLASRLMALPSHWTVAVMVPNQQGKHEAKRFGFPADNIAIWDTTSKAGLEEVGAKIRQATEAWMFQRKSGVRGSRSLFSMGADVLNVNAVNAAGLAPLARGKYIVVPVVYDSPVSDFVQACGLKFTLGSCFYQLTKTETIQPHKDIAVLEKATGKVYAGAGARGVIGLPDSEVRVKPDYNPLFDVYVQSTSTNRKLIAGTKLLVLK